MQPVRHDNRNVLYKNTDFNGKVKWHWDWIECGTATSYRLPLFWKLPPLALPRLLVDGYWLAKTLSIASIVLMALTRLHIPWLQHVAKKVDFLVTVRLSFFFCSADARDKWSQSPIKETGWAVQLLCTQGGLQKDLRLKRNSQLASHRRLFFFFCKSSSMFTVISCSSWLPQVELRFSKSASYISLQTGVWGFKAVACILTTPLLWYFVSSLVSAALASSLLYRQDSLKKGYKSRTPLRFFLLIALWSRHVKPSSAKGEERLKRKKIPKFVQAEALPESEIMYKSKDHCTGMKDRITRDREIQRYAKTYQKPSPQTSVHLEQQVVFFYSTCCGQGTWSLLQR